MTSLKCFRFILIRSILSIIFYHFSSNAHLFHSEYTSVTRYRIPNSQNSVITLTPKSYLKAAFPSSSSSSHQTSVIKEIIYIPPPLTLRETFTLQHVLDDNHFTSLLCERGYHVNIICLHLASSSSLSYSRNLFNSIKETIRWRSSISYNKINAKNIAILGSELICPTLMTLLTQQVVSGETNRQDETDDCDIDNDHIGAFLLLDPPPMQNLYSNNHQKVLERYLSSVSSPLRFAMETNYFQNYNNKEEEEVSNDSNSDFNFADKILDENVIQKWRRFVERTKNNKFEYDILLSLDANSLEGKAVDSDYSSTSANMNMNINKSAKSDGMSSSPSSLSSSPDNSNIDDEIDLLMNNLASQNFYQDIDSSTLHRNKKKTKKLNNYGSSINRVSSSSSAASSSSSAASLIVDKSANAAAKAIGLIGPSPSVAGNILRDVSSKMKRRILFMSTFTNTRDVDNDMDNDNVDDGSDDDNGINDIIKPFEFSDIYDIYDISNKNNDRNKIENRDIESVNGEIERESERTGVLDLDGWGMAAVEEFAALYQAGPVIHIPCSFPIDNDNDSDDETDDDNDDDDVDRFGVPSSSSKRKKEMALFVPSSSTLGRSRKIINNGDGRSNGSEHDDVWRRERHLHRNIYLVISDYLHLLSMPPSLY